MMRFKNTVTSAGREYTRWKIAGNFSGYDNVIEKHKNDFYVAPGDIVRWKKSNNIPFGDMLLDFCEALLITPRQLLKSNELREKETDEFWENLK